MTFIKKINLVVAIGIICTQCANSKKYFNEQIVVFSDTLEKTSKEMRNHLSTQSVAIRNYYLIKGTYEIPNPSASSKLTLLDSSPYSGLARESALSTYESKLPATLKPYFKQYAKECKPIAIDKINVFPLGGIVNKEGKKKNRAYSKKCLSERKAMISLLLNYARQLKNQAQYQSRGIKLTRVAVNGIEKNISNLAPKLASIGVAQEPASNFAGSLFSLYLFIVDGWYESRIANRVLKILEKGYDRDGVNSFLLMYEFDWKYNVLYYQLNVTHSTIKHLTDYYNAKAPQIDLRERKEIIEQH